MVWEELIINRDTKPIIYHTKNKKNIKNQTCKKIAFFINLRSLTTPPPPLYPIPLDSIKTLLIVLKGVTGYVR